MNEIEFDFRKIEPKEPTGELKFKTTVTLLEHALKHICDKKEKWRLLDEFNAVQIRSVDSEKFICESQELWPLAKNYLTLVSECALRACAEGRDHLHEVAFYPKETTKLLGLSNSRPVQLIKILGIPEKLVIILSARVINGDSVGYKIKTAYRIFPDQKRSAWKKRAKFHLEEMADMYHGKKLYLIADHMEPENRDVKEVQK